MAKKVIVNREKLEYTISHFTTKSDASSYLGVSIPTYRKLLKENSLVFTPTQEIVNGEVVRKRVRPDIDKQWMLDNWVNTNKSLTDLANEQDVSLSVLENRASVFNLTKQFKYKLNAHKLMDVTNPDACYLAGLIATDGYVNTNANFVSLTMVGESEKMLLESILKCFESDDTVKAYGRDTIKYSIRIPCAGYKEFLLREFGIPAKDKTSCVGVPKSFVSEDCAKAYVLGCFDGDGCITHISNRKKPDARLLTKSQDFVWGVHDIITKFTDVKVNKYTVRGYPEIEIGGRQNLVKFLDWIYSSTSVLKLERKYEKYLMVKDIVCSTMKTK